MTTRSTAICVSLPGPTSIPAQVPSPASYGGRKSIAANATARMRRARTSSPNWRPAATCGTAPTMPASAVTMMTSAGPCVVGVEPNGAEQRVRQGGGGADGRGLRRRRAG